MRTMRYALLTMIFASSVSASGLEVLLRPATAQALPGIPVSFELVFKNNSPDSIKMPSQLLLLVRSETIVTARVEPPPVIRLTDLEGKILGPGESYILAFESNGAFFSPSEYPTAQLFIPGVYELHAYLSDTFHYFGESLETDPARLAEALAASTSAPSVSVTITSPVGEDLQVYEAMFRASDGNWNPWIFTKTEGQELAELVRDQYSQSAYAGWFAATGIGRTTAARADNLKTWLDSHPKPDFRDDRMLRLAHLEMMAAREHGQIDHLAAHRYEVRARATLGRILATSKDVALKSRAKIAISELDEEF